MIVLPLAYYFYLLSVNIDIEGNSIEHLCTTFFGTGIYGIDLQQYGLLQ